MIKPILLGCAGTYPGGAAVAAFSLDDPRTGRNSGRSTGIDLDDAGAWMVTV